MTRNRTNWIADELVGYLLRYGSAAILLALVNAILVAVRLSRQLRAVTRVRIVAYDVALFLLLGLSFAVAASAWQLLSRRVDEARHRPATIIFGACAGGGLGAVFLASDFANFVARAELRVPPAVLGVAIGAAVGVGAAVGMWRAATPAIRQTIGSVALLLAGCNGAVLPSGYPGLHLLVLAVSLLLLAWAIPDWVQRWGGARQRVALSVGLLAVSVAPIVVPPPRVVRQNLGKSAGSAVSPFVLRWLPAPAARSARRLAVERSEWFEPRANRPTIAPQQASWFPRNGSVLLLTVEALRSDVLEGRAHDAMLPNLARIRDRSFYFTKARSPTPSTLTTVTSILTGKYYSQIYFTEHAPGKVNPIADRSVRVPELLSQAGVRTVNVRAMWGLGPNYGVGRGFAEAPTTSTDFGTAQEAMDLIVAEVGRLGAENGSRLFLYSHFVDSHAPYNRGGKRATPFESYLAEVELVDRQLGRLVNYLEEHGLASRCLLIVSADHGEAFGEHDTLYHASTVYEELLKVPLLFLHPALPIGRSDQPVALVDISPTLLDLFGVATPGDFMGQTLVPVLTGQPKAFTRPIAVDSGRRKQALYFEDGIKVHRDLMLGTVQVYDLNRDPGEQRDLTDSSRDVEPYILATERFFDVHTLKVPGWKPPWRSF